MQSYMKYNAKPYKIIIWSFVKSSYTECDMKLYKMWYEAIQNNSYSKYDMELYGMCYEANKMSYNAHVKWWYAALWNCNTKLCKISCEALQNVIQNVARYVTKTCKNRYKAHAKLWYVGMQNCDLKPCRVWY